MWRWLAHWLGLDDPSGPQYSWWSGFFGDVTIFAAACGLLRAHQCHQSGCWRLGRHPVGDGRYRCCARHHPDLGHLGRKVTAAHIAAHHAHHARQRR